MTEVETQSMGCMEVFGGNQPTQRSLSRPGLDVWVWNQSEGKSECGGGELYYLSSCASGRITRMLIADICSCGSVFSELAGELRGLMMRNVNTIKQARFVHAMNERLSRFSERGGYASALISTYFAPGRSFSLCNAGHPPPLLYDAAAARWSLLKQQPVDSLAEAARPEVLDEKEYQHFQARLGLSDVVFSYSSSLAECRDRHGHFLGVAGVLERVQRIGAKRPGEMIPELIGMLREEHKGNLQHCDATILLCQTTRTAVGWRDNLLAPFRLLGSVRNNTRVDG